MTLCDVIERCQIERVRLRRADDGALMLNPRGVSETALGQELRALKPELIEALGSPELSVYLEALATWEPDGPKDLPVVPPFNEGRARGLSWAAWWGAVARRNRACGLNR